MELDHAVAESGLISEGAIVLAQRDKTYRLFTLKAGRKLNFDKVSFYPNGAYGCPYGSSFEVDKKQLIFIRKDKKTTLTEKFKGESSTDNRGVFDDGEAQRLTEEDIVVMKGQGVKGQAIVETMIEHSTSFRDKTKYSQEKYIRKKEKKHSPVLQIIRPSTRLLCIMYGDLAPSKICFLREDTLAQILTMSNVHAHSNVVVMETCQGFLTGALLERMGGYGSLVQVFYGDFPVRTILNNFGHLSKQDLSILKMYPLHRLGELLSDEESTTSTVITEALAGLRKEGEMDNKKKGQRNDKHPAIDQDNEAVVSQDVAATQAVASVGSEMEETEKRVDREEIDVESRREQQSEAILSDMDTEVDQDKAVKGESTELMDFQVVDKFEDQANEPVAKRPKLDNDLDSDAAVGCHNEGGNVEKKLEKERADADNTLPCQGKANIQFSKQEKRQRKEEAYKEASEILSQRKMDGLVIASRFHPEATLMTMVHLLAPSRTIVVYYHILEPLVQCYKSLKESGLAFNIQISETWMRHYQVLEERTHPLMKMNGQSGYLLTATTIKQS